MSKQLDIDKSLDSDAEIEYYYDSHPTPEDLMGNSVIHGELIEYLMAVLRWQFREQTCGLYGNVNFYQTRDYRELPLAPDIAVIKGVPYQRVTSWKVRRTTPPPQVVIEIASPETWSKDITEKRDLYAQMGVQEYFVYDPNEPRCWDDKSRLRGWRLDPGTGTLQEMLPNEQGRLWSVHLESWLVSDGPYLRFSDRYGNKRLTGEEAEAKAKQAEARRADAEARAKQAETRRADAEAQRADAEAKRAEREAQRADAEARRAQQEAEARQAEARRAAALAEKLRALGLNPDEII